MTQYATMNEYLKWAKQMIARHGGIMSGRMLKDEDVLGNIATEMMTADWRWDGTGTRDGFRKQYAIWYIKRLRTRLYKTRGRTMLSLCDDMDMYNSIMSIHRTKTNIDLILDDILNSNCLKDNQKKYIYAYYVEGRTMKEIGDIHQLSKQDISLQIKKAITKLKEQYAN